ncbi:ankyrin repeat domain-containing protein [Candidatus Tisiphia endosymbiont of Nemotelus uliginosus]|uniref:ankyrin repeat domain-containing protein n=1 Tax=Candidatus Tisiphia endosymbiont of Nemotelus uliginosus TaxID=3077926 RepID=UPI0035C889F2
MAKSERGDRKELIVKNIKSIIEGHPEVSKKVKFNDNSDRHVTGILPQDLQEAVQRVQLFVNKSEPFPINSTEPKDIRDIKILETGLRQFVRILDDHPGLKPVQQEIIKEFYKFAKEGNREDRANFCTQQLDELLGKKPLYEKPILYGIQEGEGKTALHLAAERGDLKAVKQLISHSDVKAKDNRGNTPLHLAAGFGGSVDVVKELIPYSNVKAKNREGQTALHAAAYYGHLDIVKKLISHSDVNAYDNFDTTALDVAGMHNRLDVMKELVPYIDAKAKARNGRTALHTLVRRGDLGLVKELIPLSDVNAKENNGDTILLVAASKGHLDAVKKLIQAKVPINAKNLPNYDTPLHLVTQNGNLEVIKAIIEGGGNINAQNKGNNPRRDIALPVKIIQQNPEMMFQAVINNMRQYLPVDPLERPAILATKLTDIIKGLNQRTDVNNPIMRSFIKMFEKEHDKSVNVNQENTASEAKEIAGGVFHSAPSEVGTSEVKPSNTPSKKSSLNKETKCSLM